ncbi:proline and serine-rich protein 3 isoform X1 [Varanus komodoensis]|uniref:proline and serine-rich protein 3 isoform X1 n=2 Tax=Varanus komodoensis TaxID=61221 RepID=UPI001CF78CF3|nr:proline and serine-rich protein 3 isoform X1 [Varanus komodoensis]
MEEPLQTLGSQKIKQNNQAVFSKLGSPFLEVSSCRSHYYPSQAQLLSQEQRYTVLSPSRCQCRNYPTSPKQTEMLNPMQPSFLPDSSCQEVKPPQSDSASPFNESWPSTEHSSSSLTPERASNLLSEQVSSTKALTSPKTQESVSDSESILARYIARFRYGQPATRGERWLPSGQSAQFWWLSHSFSSEGTISKKATSPSSDTIQSEMRPSLLSPALDQSPSGESQDTSILDPETVNLQERAARLLHRSMSPLSSSKQVSLEGLSTTTPSAITDADILVSGCAPQHRAAHQLKGSLSALPSHIIQIPQSRYSKPEDDILFQWRLRRKMEEANKAVAEMPAVAQKSQYIQPTCASSMLKRASLKSPESTSRSTEGAKSLGTSETQLDMRCTYNTLHPCCFSNAMGNSSGQQLTETVPFSNGTVVAESPKSDGQIGVKEQSLETGPVCVCVDALSPPRPARTSKHSSQSSSYPVQPAAQPRDGAEFRQSQRPFRSRQSKVKPVRDSGKPQKNSTKHSFQHVLGEVVSERLFSPPESPVRDNSKSSKDGCSDQSVPSMVAAPSHPQLLSMAAQLLEQAEDSDGTEFEDDSLLQVLRGQREFLRSQLRAVDVRLAQPKE